MLKIVMFIPRMIKRQNVDGYWRKTLPFLLKSINYELIGGMHTLVGTKTNNL